MPPFAIFDGHNDMLLRLLKMPERRAGILFGGEGAGHLDLPRMKEGGFGGGLFAIFVPPPATGETVDLAAITAVMDKPPYDVPMPPLLPSILAQPVALQMAGHFHWMARASKGAFRACTSVAEIEAAEAAGAIAGVLHMEGAEAVAADLDALHLFHAMGLRSLGPVWSRPTIFGHGVPFRFPASPDTGPGLTCAGLDLVKECNALRIMIDLSHLNEAGFNDVARLSDAPLVATHSNAFSVTASTRNLTDRQLAMIRDSGGMVGLNFATCFLRPDGRPGGDCGWDPVLRHLDHLIAHLGEDHVGFGSDFDGAAVPDVIGDVTGLPDLMSALSRHGFDTELLHKVAWSNWMTVLRRTWGN